MRINRTRGEALRSILAEGDNCWRVSRAERAAFLVDGEAYFRAVRESIGRARHCIYIVGWDIHNELRLVRDGEDDGVPNKLGDLLDWAAKSNPSLNVYVLEWDFSMIYAMERDFFPRYHLRWKSHDRVHFHLDGEHPVGASQHQKLVVVDERIAFCGGFDLSKWRWDTPSHQPRDDRRVDPNGKPYPPFHDVQLVVDGDAAAALSDIARRRWQDATGNEVASIDLQSAEDPWPPSVEPVLHGVQVGIARTLPEYGDRSEVREVERLYLDSIGAARRFIYVENQYFTAHAIGEALIRRLEEDNGPEVIVVMPAQTGGWLEQHTMDVLRGRMLRRLRDADRHQRLRVYFARISEKENVSLMVHAKIMIVDDAFVRVGSSNISNRSMGLDSECDLAIESTPSHDCTEAITAFRRRLWAEHLGTDASSIAEAERAHGTLIEAVESMRAGERSLEPLSGEIPADVDEWVPDSALLDPEKPVEPEELFEYFVGPEQEKSLSRQLLKLGAILLALLALAAAWRWTPLSDWLNVDSTTAAARWMQAQPLTPLIVLGAFVVASLVVVPVTLMIVSTVVVFGPWLGMAYALAGSLLAALATFGLGALLGRKRVGRLTGGRINRISRAISNRGILTIITLRIVPVAPFTVINVIAGVSEIRLRDFAVGSFLGMMPGVLAMAFFTDRVVASIREPSAASIIAAIAVGGLAAAGLFGMRYWLRRRAERR